MKQYTNAQIAKVVKYIIENIETLNNALYIIENVEALNNALDDALRVKEIEQQNKRYREAIKECVERMNEGGAGTRSFVYEKLIKALEGEE